MCFTLYYIFQLVNIMASKKNDTSSPSMEQTNTTNASSSGFYIDDYSQLRLSYYQGRKTLEFGDSTDESSFSETQDTNQTDLSDASNAEEDARQKLRKYLISQIPDLPHPAFTMASIISAASKKMGSVNLKYNDRVEQGRNHNIEEIEFEPTRRSTLKPGQFPHIKN